MDALNLHGITKRFGGLEALRDIQLDVPQGHRRAIIGPNGAGKTTLFNVISGDLPPTSGKIEIFGHDVTKLPPFKRVPLGLRRTYQTSAFIQ